MRATAPLMALVLLQAVACGSAVQQPVTAPGDANLLEPGTARVACVGNGDVQVEYAAPGYDRLAQASGQSVPRFRWQLTDMGGRGACYLVGVPSKENLPPDQTRAKYVLRSVDKFEKVGGRCVCRSVVTVVKEGVFKPRKKKAETKP